MLDDGAKVLGMDEKIARKNFAELVAETLQRKTRERKTRDESKTRLCVFWVLMKPPNGLRYWQVGGLGKCLGAGKTRSQKNA